MVQTSPQPDAPGSSADSATTTRLDSARQTLMDFVTRTRVDDDLAKRSPANSQSNTSTEQSATSTEYFQPDGQRLKPGQPGTDANGYVISKTTKGQDSLYTIFDRAGNPLFSLEKLAGLDGGNTFSMSVGDKTRALINIQKSGNREDYSILLPQQSNDPENPHRQDDSQSIRVERNTDETRKMLAFNGIYTVPGDRISQQAINCQFDENGMLTDILHRDVEQEGEPQWTAAVGTAAIALANAVRDSVNLIFDTANNDFIAAFVARTGPEAESDPKTAIESASVGRRMPTEQQSHSDSDEVEHLEHEHEHEAETEQFQFVSFEDPDRDEPEAQPESRLSAQFSRLFGSPTDGLAADNFRPHTNEELSTLTGHQITAALVYRVLNQPELAAQALDQLRVESGRPENSSAGPFFLRLSTQMALNDLEQANRANDTNARRDALSALARLSLTRIRNVGEGEPALRVINETLNGTQEQPSAWRSEVPGIVAGAADANARQSPAAANALATVLTTRDPALRQRAFEQFSTSARSGDDRVIQHLATVQDYFAFTQLRDNLNAPRLDTNAVLNTLRLVEQSDPNVRGNFLSSVNASMRAANPALRADPFNSVNDIITQVQRGGDLSANIRAVQPNLLAGLNNTFVTDFLTETRNLSSIVSNPRDLVRVETPDGATRESISEVIYRERESLARLFEGFGNIERNLLRTGTNAAGRTEQIDALRTFLTDNPNALRDSRLPADFADLEAFHLLANLAEANTPAGSAQALRALTTLAANGNEAARNYLDHLTPAVSGGSQTAEQLLIALEGQPPASDQAMRDLRGRLPSVQEGSERLAVNSAMRPLDLPGGPSARTIERAQAAMRELVQQGNQTAVRTMPSLEVASLVQRLGRTGDGAPTQAQRLEIVDQITRLMNADKPQARHALMSIIAGGAGAGHSTFWNQYFRSPQESYFLPPDLTGLSQADRQALAGRALRDLSAHLQQNGRPPLSAREGGALALLAGSTTDATMRSTVTEIISRAIRSTQPQGALEGVFVAMAVEGTDRSRLGSLYLDNVQSLPSAHFNTFARWARSGDPTSINVMAAITSGLNGPEQGRERAQQVLLDASRTGSLQQPTLESLLTRNQQSGDRGNLLPTLGLVAANRQNPLPAQLNDRVMAALRTGIEAVPAINDESQRFRRQSELHDAWTANSRNWTAADGRLAATQFTPYMLERLSQRLDNIPQAAGTAMLGGLRERALTAGSGSETQQLYLASVTRLSRFAGVDDLTAVDRIRAAFNPAQLNTAQREQFQVALGSSYLSMIASGPTAEFRNLAFDSFTRSGLSGNMGLDEAEIAVLRSLASGTGPLDLNRLEQILTTRYGLGIQPPLPLVLRRMGVEGDHRAISADLVARLGGGERGEIAVRQALAGFQLYSMLPPHLRTAIAPEGADFARFSTTPQAGQTNWANLTMDNRAFVAVLQSGQFSQENLRAFGALQERLGQMRNNMIAESEAPGSSGARLIALQQERRQQTSSIFTSATARDRAQTLSHGISERNFSNRPLELGDIEMRASWVPPDSQFREAQTRAVHRLESIDRQIAELQREQTQFMTRVREIDSFLRVGTHQRMMMTSNLAGADAMAMAGWSSVGPGAARDYFARQLEVGTGAPGSTTGLDRLFRHGMIASPRLPNLDTIQSAGDFIGNLPRSGEGSALSAPHDQVNRALFNHAIERIIANPDMQAAVSAMQAFGNLDFANLVQAAAGGRRTDELSALVTRDAESIRSALAEMTPERVTRLRDAMRHLIQNSAMDAQGVELRRLATQVNQFLDAIQPADPAHNGPEGTFRAMLRAVDEGHVVNPTALQNFRNEALRVTALALAAAFTIATFGKGAIITLPLVSYLVSAGTDEFLNWDAIGWDPTRRGSTIGAWARGRGEFDEQGNYRPMRFSQVASEAAFRIGMDYAMMGLLQGANVAGRAVASQLRGPLLLNSARLGSILAESQVAPVARNFFQRFAHEIPHQMGNAFAFAGVSHAGEALGLGEMGTGILYEFARGLFSRGVPPRSIRIEGDMRPMLQELNRRGLLHTEGQNYFMRLGNRNIPILRAEGPIPPGAETVRIPGGTTTEGGTPGPGQRIFLEEATESTTGRRITPAAQLQSRNYALYHEVTGGLHDGTVIGGAGRSVSADGGIVGGTSPLVINRPLDATLTGNIEAARARIADLPPQERLTALARFVAETFSPGSAAEMTPAQRSVRDALYLDFVNQNGGRPMLLGEFIQNRLGGCREQAALFQILATELRDVLPPGTDPTMQRGNGLGTAEVINHAWNVVTVNGQQQIVDTTRGIFGRPAQETGLTFTPGRNMAQEARLGLMPADLQIREGERLAFLGSNGWRVEHVTADGAQIRMVHDAARVIPTAIVGEQVRTQYGNAPRVGDRVELRLANGSYEPGWVVRAVDAHGNLTVFKPDGIRLTVSRQQLLRSVGEMATHGDNTNVTRNRREFNTATDDRTRRQDLIRRGSLLSPELSDAFVTSLFQGASPPTVSALDIAVRAAENLNRMRQAHPELSARLLNLPAEVRQAIVAPALATTDVPIERLQVLATLAESKEISGAGAVRPAVRAAILHPLASQASITLRQVSSALELARRTDSLITRGILSDSHLQINASQRALIVDPIVRAHAEEWNARPTGQAASIRATFENLVRARQQLESNASIPEVQRRNILENTALLRPETQLAYLSEFVSGNADQRTVLTTILNQFSTQRLNASDIHAIIGSAPAQRSALTEVLLNTGQPTDRGRAAVQQFLGTPPHETLTLLAMDGYDPRTIYRLAKHLDVVQLRAIDDPGLLRSIVTGRVAETTTPAGESDLWLALAPRITELMPQIMASGGPETGRNMIRLIGQVENALGTQAANMRLQAYRRMSTAQLTGINLENALSNFHFNDGERWRTIPVAERAQIMERLLSVADANPNNLEVAGNVLSLFRRGVDGGGSRDGGEVLDRMSASGRSSFQRVAERVLGSVSSVERVQRFIAIAANNQFPEALTRQIADQLFAGLPFDQVQARLQERLPYLTTATLTETFMQAVMPGLTGANAFETQRIRGFQNDQARSINAVATTPQGQALAHNFSRLTGIAVNIVSLGEAINHTGPGRPVLFDSLPPQGSTYHQALQPLTEGARPAIITVPQFQAFHSGLNVNDLAAAMTGSPQSIQAARSRLGITPAASGNVLTTPQFNAIHSSIMAPVNLARENFVLQAYRHLTQSFNTQNLEQWRQNTIRDSRFLAQSVQTVSNVRMMEGLQTIHQNAGGTPGRLPENTVIVTIPRHPGSTEAESSHAVMQMYRVGNGMTGTAHDAHFPSVNQLVEMLRQGRQLNIIAINDGIGSGEEAARILHQLRAIARSDVSIQQAGAILHRLGVVNSNAAGEARAREIRTAQARNQNPSNVTYSTVVGSTHGLANVPGLMQHYLNNGLEAPRPETLPQAQMPRDIRVSTAEPAIDTVDALRRSLTTQDLQNLVHSLPGGPFAIQTGIVDEYLRSSFGTATTFVFEYMSPNTTATRIRDILRAGGLSTNRPDAVRPNP